MALDFVMGWPQGPLILEMLELSRAQSVEP
jgi:hypothetical protein